VERVDIRDADLLIELFVECKKDNKDVIAFYNKIIEI